MGEKEKAINAVNKEIASGVSRAVDSAAEYVPPAAQFIVGLATANPVMAIAGCAEFVKRSSQSVKDDLAKHETERAEARARAAHACQSHFTVNESAYSDLSKSDQVKVFQRITQFGVNSRIDAEIRLFAAAALGGADNRIATSDDLYTAEWLESAPDSKKALLMELCEEIFDSKKIGSIVLQPGDGRARTIPDSNSYPTPTSIVLDEVWNSKWNQKASKIWPPAPGTGGTGMIQDMFSPVGQFCYAQAKDNVVNNSVYNAGKPRKYVVWPSALLQRVHNAFVNAKEILEYEEKNFG